MSKSDTNTREDNIYFARLSEQGERYEDMIKYMELVAKVSTLMTITLVFFSVTKNSLTTKETCYQWLTRTQLKLNVMHGEQFKQFKTKKS